MSSPFIFSQLPSSSSLLPPAPVSASAAFAPASGLPQTPALLAMAAQAELLGDYKKQVDESVLRATWTSTIIQNATEKARKSYREVMSRVQSLPPKARHSILPVLTEQANLKAASVFQVEMALGKCLVEKNVQDRGAETPTMASAAVAAPSVLARPTPVPGRRVLKRTGNYGSAVEETILSAVPEGRQKRRVSCHRCGNQRKNNVVCDRCPMIFCKRCADKMVQEHGPSIFKDGCVYCKKKCCCAADKSTKTCDRMHHCLKRCSARLDMNKSSASAESVSYTAASVPKLSAAVPTLVFTSVKKSSDGAAPDRTACVATLSSSPRRQAVVPQVKIGGKTSGKVESATAATSFLLGGLGAAKKLSFTEYMSRRSSLDDAVKVLGAAFCAGGAAPVVQAGTKRSATSDSDTTDDEPPAKRQMAMQALEA